MRLGCLPEARHNLVVPTARGAMEAAPSRGAQAEGLVSGEAVWEHRYNVLKPSTELFRCQEVRPR